MDIFIAKKPFQKKTDELKELFIDFSEIFSRDILLDLQDLERKELEKLREVNYATKKAD